MNVYIFTYIHMYILTYLHMYIYTYAHLPIWIINGSKLRLSVGGDAVLKMLAIFVRMRCGLPVILGVQLGCRWLALGWWSLGFGDLKGKSIISTPHLNQIWFEGFHKWGDPQIIHFNVFLNHKTSILGFWGTSIYGPPIWVFFHHRPNVVATLDQSITTFTAPLQLWRLMTQVYL